MASLKLFVLSLLCLLATVVVGQLMPPNDNAPRAIVSGILFAHNFTDGTAVLTHGTISATSMSLRGNLWGKDATFIGLTAEDTNVTNIHTDSASLKSLDVRSLDVTGDSTFTGDVSINGSLVAGAATLNQTNVYNLTVRGDWNIENVLNTRTNVQITADINVGGSSRFKSDILANMTATVQNDLTVAGMAWSDELYVSGTTQAGQVTVDEMLKITNLLVNGSTTVGGNLYVQDLLANGSANFKGSLNANDANIVANLLVGMNATIGGDLKATNAQFGNLTVAKDSTVGGNFGVGTYIQVTNNTYVSGSVNVTSDVWAGDLVKAVTGHFTTLDVDTATIVSLTSTFVTSATVHTVDSTVLGKFVVNGPTTMDSLTVKSSSTLNDVTADSVVTQTLTAENTTVGLLTVTNHSSFDTMNVKTMLMAGRPSETDYVASFETAFSDNFTAVVIEGQTGTVATQVGQTLNYTTITGTDGQFTSSWSDMAQFQEANVTWGWISNLWANQATIDYLDSNAIYSKLINASADTTVDMLWSTNVTTMTLEAMSGYLGMDWSTNVMTENVTATNATLDELTTTTGTMNWLHVDMGTVTTLTSTNAWLKNVTGDTINFTSGTISMLTTQSFSDSLMYNATNGSSADWVWADTGKLGAVTATTLYVNGNAWLENTTFSGETEVHGKSTFQEGYISGEAVLSALTVVGETSFSELNVAGPAWLTDLWVKRVTISDSFTASNATLGDTKATMLSTTGNVTLTGIFNVTSKDSLMMGNLVVTGTTQFQTGSFSRIGTAVITTTDMEAFNMDVASGLFGAITTDELEVSRAAVFQRSISLAPMIGSDTGATYSFFTSIVPTVLTGENGNTTFDVNAQTVFHSGQATVDQLVVTRPSDPTVAALRITGDGAVDFLDGSLYFRNLDIDGGVTFDNQQNVAWPTPGVTTTRTLALGVSTYWFTFSDLIDRDLGVPGAYIDPATFGQPSDSSNTDLLTLTPGQYRVAGSVKIATASVSDADSIVAVTVGVDAYSGSQSNGSGSATWSSDCVASFGVIAGARVGGTCYFSGILTVSKGQTTTLRSRALWNFSSATFSTPLVVDPSSTLIVEELFDRTSENL